MKERYVFLFILQGHVRYISVMTQEEFTYIANNIRAKTVETAERFGYAPDDAEDIAQDVMLKHLYSNAIGKFSSFVPTG